MSNGPPPPPSEGSPWLFDRTTDLCMFGGSTALAFGGIWAFRSVFPGQEVTPVWLWLVLVVGVDVAHVHSTWFRTVLEPAALARDRSLYAWAVFACAAGGILLHAWSGALFWTCAAYLAVFHFVRQQVGWMTLYRARAHESDRLGAWIESGALYACMLWPLGWWHAHLPQPFAWFVPGDFVPGLHPLIPVLTAPVYVAFLVAFVLYHLRRWRAHATPAWGRVLLVTTTSISWYAGIVGGASDLTFTMANVLPHGIPYLVLVWRFTQRQPLPDRPGVTAWVWRKGPLCYLGLVIGAALLEEAGWDWLVWHDHAQLFGEGPELPDWQDILVPLLALPQLTHYVLDGFIWRRRSNPEVARQAS